MDRDDILARRKAAVLGESRPADFARAVFVLGHRHQKALSDAAFVAGTGRNAVAADIPQIQAHETPDTRVRLPPDAHHALPVIEIELLDDGAVDDHYRFPSGCRSAVFDAEPGIAHRLDR